MSDPTSDRRVGDTAELDHVQERLHRAHELIAARAGLQSSAGGEVDVHGRREVAASCLSGMTGRLIAGLSTPTPWRVFREGPANVWIATEPYVWLPTVMVAFAILGHIVIYRRLRAGRD